MATATPASHEHAAATSGEIDGHSLAKSAIGTGHQAGPAVDANIGAERLDSVPDGEPVVDR